MSRPRILILGGGFAGLACANGLPADRFSVTLVDRKSAFEFLPNIHELLSGVKRPRDLRLSLRAAMAAIGHRFVRGDVDEILPEQRVVRLASGRELRADYLVVALGSADADFGVEGVAAHAYPFKSVDQCSAIGRRLEHLSRGGTPARLVIVGAGITGIEALGELLRRYRGHGHHVTLIEAQTRLLPAAAPAVSAHVKRLCQEYGVELLLGASVRRITAKSVLLENGNRLRSDLTLWTGGPAPPAQLAAADLAADWRWVEVRRDLAHPHYAGVYVAGDDAQPPTPLRKQAYHALDMGRCVADNILRDERGARRRAFRASPKPTLIAFGDLTTVLDSGPAAVSGPALAAAKEAVYTAVMTQLDQRGKRQRIGAAVERGRVATQKLLWPNLRSLNALRRQGKLEVLR